ncbi:hypothetical protein COY95_05300, partial [Candidatus Woesearchaeota archaeon CG_4_10_14_0_8_um_filter_47_5]
AGESLSSLTLPNMSPPGILKYALLNGVETKQLMEIANRNCSPETPETIVCLISTVKETGGEKNTVLLVAPPDFPADVPALLTKTLAPLGGRGGGRDNHATGGFSGDPQAFIDALVKNLSGTSAR